jgi:hypothetical protein
MSALENQPDIDQLVTRIQSGLQTQVAAAPAGTDASLPILSDDIAATASPSGVENATVSSEHPEHRNSQDQRTIHESTLYSSRIMQTRLRALEGMNQLAAAAAGLKDIAGPTRQTSPAQASAPGEVPAEPTSSDQPPAIDQNAAAANQAFQAEVRARLAEFAERLGSASGAIAEALHRIEQNELDSLELSKGLQRLQKDLETMGKNISTIDRQP